MRGLARCVFAVMAIPSASSSASVKEDLSPRQGSRFDYEYEDENENEALHQ